VWDVVLSGFVAIVLAFGPKDGEFKHGRGSLTLRAIKIRSSTSIEGEEKPSASVLNILQQVKESYKYERVLRRQN
jgi:hypothetical protein